MPDQVFPLRYAHAFRPLCQLLGTGPAHSGVWVGPDAVRVTMGWWFHSEFPRQKVRGITPDGARVVAWGAWGWGGTRVVNASSSGLVRLELEPGVRARVMGIRVRMSTLRVSMMAPDDLLTSLGTAH